MSSAQAPNGNKGGYQIIWQGPGRWLSLQSACCVNIRTQVPSPEPTLFKKKKKEKKKLGIWLWRMMEKGTSLQPEFDTKALHGERRQLTPKLVLFILCPPRVSSGMCAHGGVGNSCNQAGCFIPGVAHACRRSINERETGASPWGQRSSNLA